MGATLSILSVVGFSSPNHAVFAKGGTYPVSVSCDNLRKVARTFSRLSSYFSPGVISAGRSGCGLHWVLSELSFW
jgi:hypothetical protein